MNRRVPTSTLLAGGIAGPLLFVAVFLVEGATRPGYDPVRQYVSLLSLGEGGWVQILSFVVTGAFVAGAGLGLGRSWPDAGRWVPRLIGLVGIALVWSGVFVTDPAQGYPAGAPAGLPTESSWHAGLHYLGALVVFLGLPAAILLAARSTAMPRAMSGWMAYSVVSAGLVLGLWLATFAVPGLAGLLQRVAISAGLLWLAVVSALEMVRLRGSVSAAPAGG